MNRTVLIGRMTKDPELRYTSNGVAVTNFTLAVNRPFKNQNGEYDADFIVCVAWRKVAENLVNFMSKGSQIAVDGRLQSRTYDDKDGKTVFMTELVAENIQFLESNSSGSNANQNNNSNQNQGSQQQQQQQPQQPANDAFGGDGGIDISDDDLPF